MILLLTDTHLDDQRSNAYRWRIFDEVARVCQSRPVTRVAHLGDMTEKRDYFPAAMVNRLVACWLTIINILSTSTKRHHEYKPSVSILDGNHTRLLKSIDEDLPFPYGLPIRSFWEFLSQVDGLEYVTEPTLRDDGNLILLPFSPNPRADWRGLPVRDCRAIFTHATRTGTIAENGFTLSGQDLPPIPRSVKVYSGDVHNQQDVDNWTYVGAAHPMKFGDAYKSRFLLLDENTYEVVEEIPIETIEKRVVEIRSLGDLSEIVVCPGDQIKVRADLGPGADWVELEKRIDAWALERGVEVASIEGGYDVPAQSDLASGGDQPPEDVLRTFAAEEKVADDLLDVGLELLEEARDNGPR